MNSINPNETNMEKLFLLLATFFVITNSACQTVDEYNISGVQKKNKKDYAGAIEDFNKALNIDPNNDFTYSSRANAKLKLFDYKGAMLDYNKSIDINPEAPNVYYYRGNLKIDLEDYRGAIEDFSKAINIKPNQSVFYFVRGNAKHNLGLKDSSCLDWSKAGELGYENVYDLIKEYCN